MAWLESILIPQPVTTLDALVAIVAWLAIAVLWTELAIRVCDVVWRMRQ